MYVVSNEKNALGEGPVLGAGSRETGTLPQGGFEVQERKQDIHTKGT